MTDTLRRQIGMRKPFADHEEAAFVNLQRTADALNRPMEELFRAHGITPQQYNALRILRGMADDPTTRDGLMCSQIAERMITRAPDITRLIDRLVEAGLAGRRRCEDDRRRVLVTLTKAGRKLLESLDEPVRRLHKQQLGHMKRKDLDALGRLLDQARQRVEQRND